MCSALELSETHSAFKTLAIKFEYLISNYVLILILMLPETNSAFKTLVLKFEYLILSNYVLIFES